MKLNLWQVVMQAEEYRDKMKNEEFRMKNEEFATAVFSV